MGPKTRSNTTVLFQTLLYAGNFTKPFDIFAHKKQGGGSTWLTGDVNYGLYGCNHHVGTGGETPTQEKTHSSKLEAYEVMPVFVTMNITEDSVKSVVRKLSESAGPAGTDLKYLQGWLLKFGYHSKKLCISVESFVDWLENQSPPWFTYMGFMSGCMIALNKLPGVCPVGARETWRWLFVRCVLKVTVL